MNKSIEFYLQLPYTIEMVPGARSCWVVSVKELPGCISQGDSPQDAIDMIREAMRCWLEVALEDGIPVPEPRPLETCSGKFVARVPRSLHRDLVDAAEREGVSLNQFVSTALARAIGQRDGLRAGQSERKADAPTRAAPPPPAPVYLPVEPRPVAAHLAEPAPALTGSEPPPE